MDVAIFSPFVHWPTHFATDLELAQRHLDAHDAVTVLVCNGDLPACDVNLDHNLDRCATCIDRRTAGLRLLSKAVAIEPLLDHAPPEALELAIPRFENHAAVREYCIDGFDLGNAALSSLISYRRDADCDLDADAVLLTALLRTAHLVHASTRLYLHRNTVDRFYVYNSRFASTRGVMRACAQHEVPCMVHERGGDLRHFELYPNVFPHDRAQTNRTIHDLWNGASEPERREVGAKWYRDRVIGIDNREKSYVTGQEIGLLPPGWRSDKRNIVVFTSSEDEFVAIGAEWQNPIYKSELTGVQEIVRALADAPDDLHLYVRIHPNLRGIDNRQTRGLHQIQDPHVTVVPAASPVSTYELMRRAWKVVTFGSTAGIEAVFWGVPSILAGVSWYRDLGGTYNPATHEELVSMVLADLPPRDPTAALMYGHYASRFGIPFRYFRATSYHGGEFKGVDFWHSPPDKTG